MKRHARNLFPSRDHPVGPKVDWDAAIRNIRHRERVRLSDALPEDDVAEAIYNANRNPELSDPRGRLSSSPEWEAASEDVKAWVRKQARAAEQAIKERG